MSWISFSSKIEWICGHFQRVAHGNNEHINIDCFVHIIICVGYGGFVPRTHELFGKDYEHVTHDALNLFTDERNKQEMVLTTPVSTAKTQIYISDVGSQGSWVTLYLQAHNLSQTLL